MNIGPKRDVVGEWAKACEKYDLPLGVSMHGSHAWLWFEIAQQYDANMTKEDGKGNGGKVMIHKIFMPNAILPVEVGRCGYHTQSMDVG